jgi:Family of unknown function (DUF6084)
VVDLDFSVLDAEALPFAVLPTIGLKVRIENRSRVPIRAISLVSQVRLVATQRSYSADEQQALFDVFGEPARWGQTLKSLLWTMASLQVPAFGDEITIELPIQCTYDFEIVSAKYFNALEEGAAPLELLFSGTVFYIGEAGLQVEQIGWDKETHFNLPVRVWRDVMERYFPKTAWIRLQRQTFERVRAYQMRNVLLGWDATLERLLDVAERKESVWTR